MNLRLGFPHRAGGGIVREDHRFRPRYAGVVDVRKDFDSGMGHYFRRVALALRTPGWGFYTVRGGIDPADHRFLTPFVGVVDVWKDF